MILPVYPTNSSQHFLHGGYEPESLHGVEREHGGVTEPMHDLNGGDDIVMVISVGIYKVHQGEGRYPYYKENDDKKYAVDLLNKRIFPAKLQWTTNER